MSIVLGKLGSLIWALLWKYFQHLGKILTLSYASPYILSPQELGFNWLKLALEFLYIGDYSDNINSFSFSHTYRIWNVLT